MFPKKLKIGAHQYTIEYVSVPKDIEPENCGRLNNETGVITIDNSLMETQRYEALWHEILHALNGELPEREVEGLAQQVTQVLLDNKLVHEEKKTTKNLHR